MKVIIPLIVMSLLSSGAMAASPAKELKKPPAGKNEKSASAPVRVMTAMSTSLKSGHPILFLNGETQRVGSAPDLLATRLQFPADQKYSKWSVLFNRPIALDVLEVETCKGTKPFADGVELFLDYNERRYFADGGSRTVKFKPKRSAAGFTLNFLESSGLCLEAVRITTKTEWLRPQTIPSTGDFVIADGSFGTFDRGVLDGKKIKWDGVRKSGYWKLQWENPLIVDALRVWNGNQYSGASFGDSERVKELEVVFDGGEPARFGLEDRRGFQILKVDTPRAIRSVQLRSIATYGASTGTTTDPAVPREPVLGEVQILAGGETWIPIVPVAAVVGEAEVESASAKQTRSHGYGDIIDRELRSADQKDIWKFRFRSDGTFFARFFVDRVRVARAWSASGTWRIVDVVRSTEKGDVTGLVLFLAGSKTATANVEDSLPCAQECSAFERAKFQVEDTVEIQKQGNSYFILRNRTPEESRSVDFSDLKVRLHSLYD